MIGKTWNRYRGWIEAVPAFWWYTLGWCAIVGLAVPLAGQFYPPFHILTHEFTQLYCLVTGLALFFLARWTARATALSSESEPPIYRMRRAIYPVLVGIGAMGITTLGVMLIANGIYWHCQFYRGVPFFWVTWVPVAVWAAVGGILAGMSGWGWLRSLAVPVVILALSIVQDVLQVLHGARVVDFILGELLAIDQRRGMDIAEVHFFQRMFLMLLSYSIWQVGLWRSGRSWAGGGREYLAELRHIRIKGVSVSTLAVAVALILGSHIGLGWGRAALENELSEVYQTDHFIFHYAPVGGTENNIETIASGAEWYLHRLTEHWEVEPEKPVEVYIFDGGSMYRLTGSSSAHAITNRIFITNYYALTRTFYHELVHAFHQSGLDPKLNVWLNRGVVEGVAQAYEEELVWLPEAHRDCAAALKAGALPLATDFMSTFGFWKVRETLAYNSAASFVGYLIYQYGVDTFREFQRGMDYRRVYGKTLQGLDAEWRRFLEGVPTDIDTQIRVGDYYGSAYWGAYSQDLCPKLGERRPDLEYRAGRLWVGGYYDKAHALYESLFKSTGEVRWGYQVVLCLQRLEMFDEALAMLEDLGNRADLADFERARFLRATTSILMRQRDWPALYAAFDRLAELEGGERGEDQRIVESLLRIPEFREPVAEALLTSDSYRRRQLLDELADSNPDNMEVQYLYVTRAFGTVNIRSGGAVITPQQESQIADFLDYIETVPDAADKSMDVLLNYGVVSIQARSYDLAAHIGDSILRRSSDPLNRFKAERLLERLEFERSYRMHND